MLIAKLADIQSITTFRERFTDTGLGLSNNLPSSSQSTTAHHDPGAWKIIREFATTDLSLPNAEIRLQAHLGNRYIDSDWQPALKAVMDANGLEEEALNAIDRLEHDAKARAGLKIRITLCPPQIPQIQEEARLMETVNTLKSRNRIFDPSTLQDLVDPPEEKEIRRGPMTELNRER
ncbi:hypothetical protein OG21DRAFT_1488994 [Imleria badia]|nr:hypothetical protein OG21DRAFT_1488994 [Imleria badia]